MRAPLRTLTPSKFWFLLLLLLVAETNLSLNSYPDHKHKARAADSSPNLGCLSPSVPIYLLIHASQVDLCVKLVKLGCRAMPVTLNNRGLNGEEFDGMRFLFISAHVLVVMWLNLYVSWISTYLYPLHQFPTSRSARDEDSQMTLPIVLYVLVFFVFWHKWYA